MRVAKILRRCFARKTNDNMMNLEKKAKILKEKLGNNLFNEITDEADKFLDDKDFRQGMSKQKMNEKFHKMVNEF